MQVYEQYDLVKSSFFNLRLKTVVMTTMSQSAPESSMHEQQRPGMNDHQLLDDMSVEQQARLMTLI